MRYVCGFAYGSGLHSTRVFTPLLLARRLVLGGKLLLRGVEGPTGVGESARSAMVRVFASSTGISTEPVNWSCFHHERFRDGREISFLHSEMLWPKLDMATERFPLFTLVNVGTANGRLIGNRKDFEYNLPYLLMMSRAIWNLPADNRPLES